MSLKTKVVVHCESHTEMLISFFNATTNCEDLTTQVLNRKTSQFTFCLLFQNINQRKNSYEKKN